MPNWKVTNRASITNQPAWTVGGLGPTVGKGPFASNAIQINANGQGPFRFRTFCPNQLGNIGGGLRNSMFGPSADGTNGCRDQPCVNPPYCAPVGKSLASSEHTLTIGCSSSVVPCPSLFVGRGFGTTEYQPTAFGSLSNPIFSGLPIMAATYACCTPTVYSIFFPTASVNQLQSMNISIEVTNNQESADAGPVQVIATLSYPGARAVFYSINTTFINIVNTVGNTYTLKIKQNP
jgi:hypothetical protein